MKVDRRQPKGKRHGVQLENMQWGPRALEFRKQRLLEAARKDRSLPVFALVERFGFRRNVVERFLREAGLGGVRDGDFI